MPELGTSTPPMAHMNKKVLGLLLSPPCDIFFRGMGEAQIWIWVFVCDIKTVQQLFSC